MSKLIFLSRNYEGDISPPAANETRPPLGQSDSTEKNGSYYDQEKKGEQGGFTVASDDAEPYAQPVDVVDEETGKEKVMRTAADLTQRAISLADDPTQPVFTFRVFFLVSLILRTLEKSLMQCRTDDTAFRALV